MKKRYVIFTIIFTMLIVTGCQKKDELKVAERENVQSEEVKEMKEPLMTEAYLIKNCGIPEENLKDIDVLDFIETYELREGDEKEWDILFLIESYKGQYKKQESPYAYLLTAEFEKEAINRSEFSQIKVLVLYEINGSYQETVILDKSSGEGNYGKAIDLLSGWNEDSVSIALEQEFDKHLVEILEKNKIDTWEIHYKGSSEDTTGSFSWTLYLELENGKVYRYSGSGVQGNNKAEHWKRFKTSIKSLVKE